MSIRTFFKAKKAAKKDPDEVQHANFKGTRFSKPRFVSEPDHLVLPQQKGEGLYAFVGGSFNVREDLLRGEAYQDMLDDLTLEPWVSPGAPGKRKAGGGGPTYPVFDVAKLGGTTHKFLRLPRAYGLHVFPSEFVDWHAQLKAKMPPALRLKEFNGSLKPYQDRAVTHVVSQLETLRCHSGLLSAGCGAGKTVMALYVAHLLGLKCAILVHTSALLNQWIERIHQFLPQARVGVLQGPNRPAGDDDVCVCMLQTLTKLRSGAVLKEFGFLVVDECHHICCRTFSKGLRLFQAPYVLGLSATPERTDRLGFAIEWLIGPLLYSLKRVTSGVKVQMIAYKNEGFQHATRRWDKTQLDYVKTLSLLVDDQWRTRRLAEDIYDRATKESRQIIVIASRIRLLKDLARLLPGAGLFAGSAKSKPKKAEREEAKLKQVILASTAVASEGLDIPRLDTLYLATPCKPGGPREQGGALAQCVGRILRGKSERPPLIVDFYDKYQMFSGMAWRRERWYRDDQLFQFLPRKQVGPPAEEDQLTVRDLQEALKGSNVEITEGEIPSKRPPAAPAAVAAASEEDRAPFQSGLRPARSVSERDHPFPPLVDAVTVEEATAPVTAPPQEAIFEEDSVSDLAAMIEALMDRDRGGYAKDTAQVGAARAFSFVDAGDRKAETADFLAFCQANSGK